MPLGSVTALTLGFALMMIPEAAIAQAIAIAALPAFSTQVALGHLDEMRRSLAALLRGLLFLAVPASLGLILLRVPLVTLIYQRGEFNPHSTQLVAWALLWYAAGLVGHSVVEIVSRAFYALHDTKTPVMIGVVAMSLNIALSFALQSLFLAHELMPHGALALANTIATFLEMGALLFFMRRRLSGLEGKRVLNGFLQALLGAGAMSLALWGWMRLVNGLSLLPTADAALSSLGGIIIGVLVYGLSLYWIRVPEMSLILKEIRKRLVKKTA